MRPPARTGNGKPHLGQSSSRWWLCRHVLSCSLIFVSGRTSWHPSKSHWMDRPSKRALTGIMTGVKSVSERDRPWLDYYNLSNNVFSSLLLFSLEREVFQSITSHKEGLDFPLTCYQLQLRKAILPPFFPMTKFCNQGFLPKCNHLKKKYFKIYLKKQEQQSLKPGLSSQSTLHCESASRRVCFWTRVSEYFETDRTRETAEVKK